MASRYGAKSKEKVARAMHERKRGTLKSGSGRTVKSRKQAIAIDLSEARREGGKVPARRKASSASKRKSPARSKTTGGRKTSSRRKSTGVRKSTAGRNSTAGRKRASGRKTVARRKGSSGRRKRT